MQDLRDDCREAARLISESAWDSRVMTEIPSWLLDVVAGADNA